MSQPFYIITSIAYVNAAPHVGFAMEAIEADVIARWMRLQGREAYFVTGTDEHGVKIAKTAKEQGISAKELCDLNAEKFQELTEKLNLSNNDFIRTSDQQRHWPGPQKIWELMKEKGDIEKRKYTALYCSGCEAFYTEKDLNEEGECPYHKKKPETISEENYFFCLSKYSDQIAEFIESDTLKITPSFRKKEILNMVKEGLHDVSFSRPVSKLPWGVPVPGDDSQTMYVWCDALTNYISVLGFGRDNESLFEKFWSGGEVMHVIGKDIVRFHAGIWIGMLLSAGIKIPENILVHGFLTSEGHKMSKSLGNVVDPFLEIETYSADALRYFLIREVPIGRDADFSRERFETNYQAHLANGLGNLCSRVHKLCADNDVLTPSEEEIYADFAEILQQGEKNLQESMEEFALHDALSALFDVVSALDKKMNELAPWELIKNDPEEGKKILSSFLLSVLWIAQYIAPFLPETSEKMKQMFGEGKGTFGERVMLFPRLEKLKEEN